MTNNTFEKIQKLKELLDAGILTEEEFANEKAKILGTFAGQNAPVKPSIPQQIDDDTKDLPRDEIITPLDMEASKVNASEETTTTNTSKAKYYVLIGVGIIAAFAIGVGVSKLCGNSDNPNNHGDTATITQQEDSINIDKAPAEAIEDSQMEGKDLPDIIENDKTKVGTLTAFYAKNALKDFRTGELIVDSNDPINRIVSYDQNYWKYEGDDTGEYYSSNIPKSKVTVKTWEMNDLPVSMVKNGATFVATSGREARIFLAANPTRKFCNYDGQEICRATETHQSYIVLSAWIKNYDGSGSYLFEEPLYEERGKIKLYQHNRFGDGGCRKRPGRIGIIEEEWCTPVNWPTNKSAYDNNGKQIVDLVEYDGLPSYISIAYIASENALYINGEVYYKK